MRSGGLVRPCYKGLSAASILFLSLCGTAFLAMPVSSASAVTTITAVYTTASIPIDGVVSPGEWTATPVNISTVGLTATFEQNSTGLIFLLQWQSGQYCSDKYCFGGIEMGNLNNTSVMGTSTTPTIMVLISPSFTSGYDEFVSEGEQTPTSVESLGYSTQSICALNVSGNVYTAECYRPFMVQNATPNDPFSGLVSGSPIELGFAVGEFSQPGFHGAVGAGTYELTLSTPPLSSMPSTTSTASKIVQATHQSLSLSLHDIGITASVDLLNSTGNPVPHASVSFSVMTDFGLMLLGSNNTNSTGVATFSTNILPGGWTEIYTFFAGSGNLNASSASLALDASALDPPPNSASPYISGQGGTVDLRLVGTQPIQAQVVDYTFLAVLTCVYLLFAVVLIKVSRIRKRA